MKINIIEKEKLDLPPNNVNVILEYKFKEKSIDMLEQYINNYNNTINNVIVRNKFNSLIPINKKDIILFYSQDKINYCQTLEHEYIIQSKLYEIEKFDKDFLRISKNCIVNIKHIKCFEMGQTRKNSSKTRQ